MQRLRGTTPIPLFILILISVLYLAHYFVYVSLVHFFSITSLGEREAVGAVLFLLPLGLIASSFLAHWRDDFFTRALYFCTSLWLGVGLTLLTFLALAWTAAGVAIAFGRNPHLLWLGSATLALTVLYSAYGVVNAYHPRIVNIHPKIKGLPSYWKDKKLVHLSDVHLGRILRAGFLARVVDKVNAQKPAMVLITGDLFDGALGNLEELIAPLNRLKSPLGIFFVTGNHETYLGVERAYAALSNAPVKILDDDCVVVHGLQLIGISYPRGRHAQDFAERMARVPGFNPDLPSILLYHSPSQISAAKAAGIGLQLSGHVHQGQIFPLQFVTQLIFGRYYHGLHTLGEYTVYTTSGVGAWGPTMRTGNHPEIVVINL